MSRRKIPIAIVLGLLVLATTLPLGLFAGRLIWTSWKQQQAMVARQNIDTARAISVGVDQEVRGTIAALNVLASVDAVDRADWRAFYDLALRMLPLHQNWYAIRLIRPSGEILVNTEVSLGQSSRTNADWVVRVRDTGHPAVSLLHQGRDSQEFFISVGVPVVRSGSVVYVLGARLRSTAFSETLRRQNPPPDGVVTLLDANQMIIARTRNEDRYLGTRPAPEFVAHSRETAEGSWRSVLLEGNAVYSAHSRSSLTGWTVGVGMPAELVDGQVRRSLGSLIGAGIAVVAFGFLLALLIGRGMVRAQLAVGSAARALAAGDPHVLPRSNIAELSDLSDALRDASSILTRRLEERNRAEQERERAAQHLEAALAAEQEARAAGEKNEVRLAVTLQSIGDAVIATDAAGRITLLNRVAQSLTEWTEADAIGQPIERVFATFTEDARRPEESVFARVLGQTGSAPVTQQAILRARSGREIPVADTATPIRASAGTLLGVIVVFRDITAERDAERQRAAILDREQAARRAAERLNRTKDEFVATVSHELRTPLNAIFGWVAMLRSGKLDPERQQHAIDVIHRNTIAQARLIEDLLDMSRVIRGTVRLDMQPVDVAVVLHAAVDAVQPTADARRITLQVDAPQGLGIVSGDQSRLQQIIWNLLSNSVKFTPHGGSVTATVDVEGDDVFVRVSDTGEGISPEFLPHVFDRFRQEVAHATRTHSGLGIGLSLVRHLTELHGGTVSAESAGKDQGATFTIQLPLLGARVLQPKPPAAEPRVRQTDEAALLRGRHVLVVDDDYDARELIAMALRQAGASVTSVDSVSQALVMLARTRPDAVVTDIAMPNASGYDLVRRLRTDPVNAGMPVVAITAYDRLEDRERAMAEGFDAHVGKPFDPRAVVGLLVGLVSNS